MRDIGPQSWLEKAVGVCLSVLVGAAAIYIAVHLIMAVWTTLLVILGVGAVVAAAGYAVHVRRQGW